MTDLWDLVEQVDLAAAEPYLRSHGWELVSQGALGNRWRLRQDYHTRNVALPLPLLDDLDRQRMLMSAVRTLADIEGRDTASIVRDLREASSDLVEFRVIAEPLTAGEMPLRAASELTGGAYGALQAAARAEIARRPHYAQGTLPAPVRGFLDSATLAGTDRGSVILRVRPPAPTEPAQASIEGLDTPAPFERRVAARLLEGVRAAKVASHRDPTATDLDALDDDIEDGLSANLCDALLDLAGTKAGLGARVGVRVRWALTRPADEPATSVEVERGELGRLGDIALLLKQIEPRPNVVVSGPVTRFHREPGAQTGEVWLLAQDLDGKVRSVRMELERSDYDIAMYAHGRDLEVRATGTLERAGRARELTDPRAFEVLGERPDVAT